MLEFGPKIQPPDAGDSDRPMLSRSGSIRDRAGARYSGALSQENSNTAYGKEATKFQIQQSGKEIVQE